MFYVYVLESEYNREMYTGRTADLKKRLKEHNCGKTISTKRYIPWKLVYYEACTDEEDAVRRERYLKTNQGHRYVRMRLREYFIKANRISTTG